MGVRVSSLDAKLCVRLLVKQPAGGLKMLFSIIAAVTIQAIPVHNSRADSILTGTWRAATMAADTPQVVLDSATLASAYFDPGARDLVEGAREYFRIMMNSISAYETIVRDRTSHFVRTGWRERLSSRNETAARIHWRRGGPVRMEVLGAREVSPLTGTDIQIPDELNDHLQGLVFPWKNGLVQLTYSGGPTIRSPLARGSERYYRFRSGDTTEVRLPSGRIIRVIELEIMPRRASPTRVRGSFWLDAGSHAVVRAAYRPSAELRGSAVARSPEDDEAGGDTVAANASAPDEAEGDRIAGPDESQRDPVTVDDRGGLAWRILEWTLEQTVERMLPETSAHVRYVTIDYGLWDMRWWLPRVVAFEAVAVIAGVEQVQRYERRYGAYSIVPDTTPAISAGGAALSWRADSSDFTISIRDDTASLLTSEHLPPSLFTDDAGLIDDSSIDALVGELYEMGGFGGGGATPSDFAWSGIDWDPLIRYNRVEALSLGLRAGLDAGPVVITAATRIGTADGKPRGALSVVRRNGRARYHLTGYRRLETMDPRLGLSNVGSASALLFGYDESNYYDALGVSLAGRPPTAASQWYEWRLYAQRERGVRKETDFSVPNLFDDSEYFRANPAAAEAVQYGAELALRRWWGRDPDAFRAGGELRVHAAAGDYEYVRPSLSLRTTFPLPGAFVGALEAGAGTVWGDPALQHLRRVGGTPSLRGYHGSALVGESAWRLRAELATRLPYVRLVLFSDAGWAGPFEAFGEGEPLDSAGVGASFFDGIFRVDVARALVAPTAWRVALYLGGAL